MQESAYFDKYSPIKGVWDEMYGQDVGVAIVLKGGQKLRGDELRNWLAEKLAKFKVPKKAGFLWPFPILPLTSNRSTSRTICQRLRLERSSVVL